MQKTVSWEPLMAVQREKEFSLPAMRAWSSSSRLRIHLSKQLVPFHKIEVSWSARKFTTEKKLLRNVKKTKPPKSRETCCLREKKQHWILVEMKYLVYTDKRSQESSELEVLFVVEQPEQSRGFCKGLSEYWWNLQTALNEVTHAEHSDETLQKHKASQKLLFRKHLATSCQLSFSEQRALLYRQSL